VKRISEEDLQHIYNHTTNIWDDIRDKSIFITGATGFFGRWLLESFLYVNNKLSLNAKIVALSRDPDVFLQQYPFYKSETSIRFIKGDVQNFDFPLGDFQFIVHAATDADAKLNSEDPLLMLDTITAGTMRILDFAKMQPLKSFLLTSSGAVYGKQPADVVHIKEHEGFFIDINNPASAYAEGKRIAELYCSIYHKQYNLPVKIARCFAFVGPYLPLDKHFAIGNFILNGLNNEDIIIKGDGSPYRSYLYAADLTIWLWTILLKGKENVPYNVGSDFSLTIKDTAKAVAESFNNSINYQIIGKPTNLPVQRYVPDICRANTQLGLKVKINLDDAIKRTCKFYLK
jgi:nucleoside-diphosphate-sugar epimerase